MHLCENVMKQLYEFVSGKHEKKTWGKKEIAANAPRWPQIAAKLQGSAHAGHGIAMDEDPEVEVDQKRSRKENSKKSNAKAPDFRPPWRASDEKLEAVNKLFSNRKIKYPSSWSATRCFPRLTCC